MNNENAKDTTILSKVAKPMHLQINDGKIIKDRPMYKIFNTFFANVLTRDDSCLPPQPHVHLDLMTIPEVVFMTEKIFKKLVSLKESSACGPDGLCPILLEHAALVLLPP